jgi:hypothetical protein
LPINKVLCFILFLIFTKRVYAMNCFLAEFKIKYFRGVL